MKELLKNFEFNTARGKIETLYNYFFYESQFSVIVFALSILYIYLTEEDKKIKSFFVGYTLVILAIIWNPFVIHILEEFINFGAMYRLYYMIPMYPSIAYMFTKIVKKYSKNWQKIICMLVICVPILAFGRNVFKEFPLQEIDNLYKLPEETIYVADTIYNDNKYKDYKSALVPYGISSQIQQIHPEINLVYTRIVTNIPDANGNPSPADSDDPENIEMLRKINDGDTKYIIELCEISNVNYIALYDSTELSEPLEDYGYEVISSKYGIKIYRKISFEKK